MCIRDRPRAPGPALAPDARRRRPAALPHRGPRGRGEVAVVIAALDLDHPWPGPDSFRTQDAAFFRGRDGEIKQLLQLVRRERSVVLYGASGLGKTSLINAGLIPRLGDDYFAVPIRISYVAGAPSVSEQLQTEILRSRV